jgi:hypothetical protein
MMPCRLCSPIDKDGIPQPFEKAGKLLKGLKQKGKTNYSPNGMHYERIYFCQDCGAKWKMKGTLGANPISIDVPVLEIV